MKKLFIIVISIMFVFTTAGVSFADSNAEVNDVAASITTTTTDNSKNKNTNRQFVNPGITPLPMTNGFFTAPTPDSSFRSIKDILKVFVDGYEMRFTEGALEKLASGGDVDVNFQVVREHSQVARIYTKDNNPAIKWFHIGIEAPVIKDGKIVGTEKVAGLKVTGLVDIEADDAETNSLQVIGQAALEALKDGNNFMILTAEGAHRKVEASGWGVGFYTVGGQVSDGGQTSGIVGGGMGYAKNETGPEDRPWIQGYVGCKVIPEEQAVKAVEKSSATEDKAAEKKPAAKKAATSAAPAPVQTGNHKGS